MCFLRKLGLAGALVALAAGCARPQHVNYFQEGEDLYLKGEYDAAIDRFKLQLQQKPEDAGAHFYLGSCYLYAAQKNIGGKDNAWLGIAQGELETALALFERGGKVNPVPRFDATYFEMICHINQAKIYLLLIQAIAQNPRLFVGVIPREAIPAFIEKCNEQAKLAEQVAPGNPDVEQLKMLLAAISGAVGPVDDTTPPQSRPRQRQYSQPQLSI